MRASSHQLPGAQLRAENRRLRITSRPPGGPYARPMRPATSRTDTPGGSD
ncbi:hypothetical protein [Lysobacter gummosus]